ncbi:MAG: NDP-sugar synthase [Patescibacteria group bacterium]
MKTIILCAGDGERLKPATDTIPKPLLLINDRPILSYTFSALPDTINDIVLVIQEKHKLFFEHFLETLPEHKDQIRFVFQDMTKKGTYHALLSAKSHWENEDSFLVINGDDIFLKQDLTDLITLKAPTYGLSYKKVNKRYRTCDLDQKNHRILSFRRLKADEKNQIVPCFSGAYTLTKDFLSYKPSYVEGEAGIPHTLFSSGVTVSYLILTTWLQINTPEDLEQARLSLKDAKL